MYDFDDGFEEEDPLWTPDTRETKDEVAKRAAAVFDKIFTQDGETCEQKLAMFEATRR